MERYHLTVFYTAKSPEAAKKLLEEVEKRGIADAVRAEEGCLCYRFFLDAKDPCTILLLEEWETQAHQKVHVTQPHMDLLRALKSEYVLSTKARVLQ